MNWFIRLKKIDLNIFKKDLSEFNIFKAINLKYILSFIFFSRYDPMNFAQQKTNDNKRKKQEVKKSLWESISDFPQILPFEEIDRDFSRRSLDIPQNQGSSLSPSFSSSFSPSFSSPSTSRRGAGRALTLTPEEFGLDGFNGLRGLDNGPGSGPRPDPVHDLSKPYQFAHVDAPQTFKAGHSR